MQQQPAKALAKAKKSSSYTKPLVFGLGFLFTFWLGMNIGNGTIEVQANKESSQNSGLPADLNYAEVERLYDLLKSRYDGSLKEADLIEGLKSGLVSSSNDPYTGYFDPAAAKELEEQLSGSFTGIGAQLGLNDKKEIEVVSPIDGTPAQRAGLKPKDIIATVNDQSTSGWSVDEAVSKIRGPEGSEVKLLIVRGSEPINLTIKREQITMPSVEQEMRPDKVGYIRITQFTSDAAVKAEQAARDLKQQGAKSIVLDLRDNPGGLVSAAVDISSLWLPKGKIVMQEKRGGVVVKTYYATGNTVLAGMKTSVLINAGSASASEIVAGALRDNKAATLIGEKSYGKGSVQEVRPLSDGGELKVTVARWFRPNGQNIDKKGIMPDTKVSVSAEDIEQQKDPQLDAAIQKLQ